MHFFWKCLLYAVARLAGPERTKKLIPALAGYAGLDLLLVAYNEVGILKFENEEVSGEQFLITRVLKKNLEGIARPVLFDVGANVGKYSIMLAKEFPAAQIFAFEPNENTFTQLRANVGHPVICVNAGIGAEEKIEKMFTYGDNLASSHASMYGEVFRTFHKRDDLAEIDFWMTTLDRFCERQQVSGIDFLKIDTEGNELNVLKGAARMLAGGRIRMIQFEFGECDVFSRVFLQDFYSMLSDFDIYRLDSERLIPLFEYASTNEIFRYQNFFAVRKDFSFHDGR